MALKDWKNLPDTSTPITATNLENDGSYLKELINGTVLFSDDNGIVGNDIPLSDSKNNYDYVKITYSINKGHYMTLEFPTIANYVSLFFPTNTSSPAISIRNARYTFENNKLKFTYYSSIVYDGTNLSQASNAIYVHKVIGYKNS